ncbi:MAG: site-2 protease family protein [Gammaproteobacteria bacterium]|nr:site-2 protease family protein [Gammaproteobacteria bacterium]
MPPLSIVQIIAVWIIPVLFAITMHEAAHAYIAYRCGDTTAKALGRLSLNPLRHVDLVGTLLIPLLVATLSGFQFIFGWAKPVPITWHQLRHPRRDMALVAAAGPLSNFLMAFLWAGCAKVGWLLNPNTSTLALFLFLSGQAGLSINLILGILNLIPLPPLDGSKILASLLPLRLATYYLRLEPFGFIILLVLLVTNVLGQLIYPPIHGVMQLFSGLFNLPL